MDRRLLLGVVLKQKESFSNRCLLAFVREKEKVSARRHLTRNIYYNLNRFFVYLSIQKFKACIDSTVNYVDKKIVSPTTCDLNPASLLTVPINFLIK